MIKGKYGGKRRNLQSSLCLLELKSQEKDYEMNYSTLAITSFNSNISALQLNYFWYTADLQNFGTNTSRSFSKTINQQTSEISLTSHYYLKRNEYT